jgi:8-oxo-dGTP pyrophosphatase MutT (NUDIX family)
MARRPDIVDVWLFRVTPDATAEVLMLHRAPERVLPNLWQGVSGRVEPEERVVEAAWREVREETGFTDADVETAYHLDYVSEFLWEPLDATISSVYFGFRVRGDRDPVLSHEHDRYEWLPVDAAISQVVWPGYRVALEHLRDNLLDPERAPWFELDARPRRSAGSAR